MKKLIALLMALILVISRSATVFADEATSDGEVLSNKVTVIIDSSSVPDDVFYVVVNWNSLNFTYSFGDRPVWNPEEHVYETKGEGYWDKQEAGISVTNHSNVAISATAKFANNSTEATVNNVTATLSNASFQLNAAVAGSPYDAADSKTVALAISGEPDAGTRGNFEISTISITIAKVS